MSSKLEARIEALEREVREVAKVVQTLAVRPDWRSTFGMSANDPGFEEMVRLGREYRMRQRPKSKRNARP